MRRKEKAVTEKDQIEAILDSAPVCRIAMVDEDGHPYLVPLCFGYADNTLFFHCATEGRKLEILRQNSRVCFEAETDVSVLAGTKPCGWGLAYRSVIGYGNAEFLTDPADRRQALDTIMRHYAGDGTWDYPDAALEKTLVFRVRIDTMTGKRSG